MSYLALYRKYRPEKFDDVVGQNHIVKILENSILYDKLSHAYLFSGPRGTGKTTIAKVIAKIINCHNKNGINPCGECPSCIAFANKNNPDIIEIDAASNNGVDEIREIRNKVNLVPTLGKYKIYIIDEVHMLTTGAFNALLKTLEEPPSHIIFILATTEIHKIPTTILSRCQRFDFKKLALVDIENRLSKISEIEKIKITKQGIYEIARLSDGGMRDAINLLDQVSSYSNEEITIDDIHDVNGSISVNQVHILITSILNKNINMALDMIDKYCDTGKSVQKIAEECTEHIKNLLIAKIDVEYIILKNVEYEEYIKDIKQIEQKTLMKLLEEFNMTVEKIKNNFNSKLPLEIAVIKLCRIQNPIKEVSTIIKKEIGLPKIRLVPILEEIKRNYSQNINNIEKSSSKENEVDEREKNHKNDNYIEQLQTIRVENTLAKFNKAETAKIRELKNRLNEYLLDPINSQLASLLLDGEIKAASLENIMYVYKTNAMAEYFNSVIADIEQLVNEVFEKKYKLIAVNNISWEIIKEEFNSKNKEYTYKEEPIEIIEKINKIEKEKTSEINDIFGNVVEYE